MARPKTTSVDTNIVLCLQIYGFPFAPDSLLTADSVSPLFVRRRIEMERHALYNPDKHHAGTPHGASGPWTRTTSGPSTVVRVSWQWVAADAEWNGKFSKMRHFSVSVQKARLRFGHGLQGRWLSIRPLQASREIVVTRWLLGEFWKFISINVGQISLGLRQLLTGSMLMYVWYTICRRGCLSYSDKRLF